MCRLMDLPTNSYYYSGSGHINDADDWALLLDVFTRCIRGWELSPDITHELAV